MFKLVKSVVPELWLVKARLGVYLGSFLVIEILFSLLLLAKNVTAAETFARSFVVAFLAAAILISFGFYHKNENLTLVFSLLLVLGVVLLCINEPVEKTESFIDLNRDSIHIITATAFSIILCEFLVSISKSFFKLPNAAVMLCGVNLFLYILLFLFGKDVSGVKVSFFGINLCEIAKLIFLAALAYFYSEIQLSEKRRLLIIVTILMVNCIALFILSELGTACIIAGCFLFTQFLYGKFKTTVIVFSIFLLITAIIISSVILLHNNQMGSSIISDNVNKIYYRLFSSGATFQMEEAMLAVLNGGALGITTYKVDVPVISSDFVVTSVLQHFGLITFVAYIIGLIIIVVIWCKKFTEKNTEIKEASLVMIFGTIGFFSLMIQTLCSVFMSLNLFPIIGICNPFIDAHGSNLMVSSSLMTATIYGLSERKVINEKREKVHRLES